MEKIPLIEINFILDYSWINYILLKWKSFTTQPNIQISTNSRLCRPWYFNGSFSLKKKIEANKRNIWTVGELKWLKWGDK